MPPTRLSTPAREPILDFVPLESPDEYFTITVWASYGAESAGDASNRQPATTHSAAPTLRAMNGSPCLAFDGPRGPAPPALHGRRTIPKIGASNFRRLGGPGAAAQTAHQRPQPHALGGVEEPGHGEEQRDRQQRG